jgi:Tfp pilus assembly protein PilO
MRPGQPRPLWARARAPLLVLLGLNAAVFGAYTVPRTLEERSLAAQAATLRQAVERERAATLALGQRVAAIRANAADAERFLTQVLEYRAKGLLPVLEEVERVAGEAGLELKSRRYSSEEVTDSPLIRFRITIPVNGSYAQLVSFIDRLERSPRFLVIDRVLLREGRGSDEDQLNVVVSTYFRAGREPQREG